MRSVLVFILFSAILSALASDCPFGGDWTNQRGSKMQLTSCGPNGTVAGTYTTSVGHADGEYALLGRYDPESLTLGWTVAWNNEKGSSASTTTWSGQYFVPEDIIITTFILSRQVATYEDRWSGAFVGDDYFTRSK